MRFINHGRFINPTFKMERLINSIYFLPSNCLSRIFITFAVIDAMGKPPSGLLDYHTTWLGSYDECIGIEAAVNISGVTMSPYKGRYCKTVFQTGGVGITIGMCVPNTCSNVDTGHLVDTCKFTPGRIKSLNSYTHDHLKNNFQFSVVHRSMNAMVSCKVSDTRMVSCKLCTRPIAFIPR